MNHVALTVRFQPDTAEGQLSSITLTLGSSGTITTIEIPNWANGFRLYPDGEIKFAVNKNPQDLASALTTITKEDLGNGGYARANSWEVRLLESTPSRELRLFAVTGGETVDVEIF